MKKHNYLICKCASCRSKRKDSHKQNCNCSACKSKRGEFKPYISNCLNCNITIKANKKKKFCSRNCFREFYSRKHGTNFKDGRCINKICIDCGKETNKNGRAKRCKLCNSKYLKTVLYKHHIRMDGDDNNILLLKNRLHLKLHRIAYEYLILINKEKDYIKWFIEKYGTE